MKNKTKKENKSNFGLIENLVNEISPEEQRLTDRKMLLAVQIDEAMKSKGIKKGQLAKMLGKQPSEITKWLSGTHNFTIETLWEIGDALNIELINIWKEQTGSVFNLAQSSSNNQSFSTTWPATFNFSDL